MATPANPIPPPPFPPLMESGLPIDSWEKLVVETQHLLENIVYYWDQLLFKRNFRRWLRAAWDDVKSVFGTYTQNAIGDIQAGLSRIGFAGNQLKLKLETVTEILSRFKENGLPYLKDLLEYLSVLFDSLAKVFPQLEAVKEIIDGVTWYLGTTEKWTANEVLYTIPDVPKPPAAGTNEPEGNIMR